MPLQNLDSKPLITVVITTHNLQEYVSNAILSVRKQTYRNVEILVSDDCSTDDTKNVVEQLAKEDERIRFIQLEQNSGGAGAPRNHAVREARGEYVLFLDGDDELQRHAIANLYRSAKSTRADITSGLMVRRILESGKIEGWYPALYAEEKVLDSIEEFPEFFDDTNSTNKLYRRDFLLSSGLMYRERVHYEDVDFTAKALLRAKKIGVITDRVYYWNVYSEEDRKSITNQRDTLANIDARFAALDIIGALLEESEATQVRERFVRKCLRHHYRLYLNDIVDADATWSHAVLERIAKRIRTLTPSDFVFLNPVERALYAAVLIMDIEAVQEAVRYETNQLGPKGRLLSFEGETFWWTAASLSLPKALLEDDFATGLCKVERSFTVAPVKTRPVQHELLSGKQLANGNVRLNCHSSVFDPRLADVPINVLLKKRNSDLISRFTPSKVEWSGTEARWSVDVALPDLFELDYEQRWVIRVEVSSGGSSNEQNLTNSCSRNNKLFLSSGSRAKDHVFGRLKIYKTLGGNTALKVSLGRFARLLEKLQVQRLLGSRGTEPSKIDVVNDAGSKKRYARWQRQPLSENTLFADHNMGAVPADSVLAVVNRYRELAPSVDVVWAVSGPSVHVPSGDRKVVRHSAAYYKEIARAKRIIDNQSAPGTVQIRAGQIYLQTWHGIPLKVMGLQERRIKNDSAAREQIISSASRWTALVSPSDYFEQTFVRDFGYEGRLITPGTPRNDVLVNEPDGTTIRSELGIDPAMKVVLYAPTFRENQKNKKSAASLYVDLAQLVEELGDDHFILVRSHYLNKFSIPRRLVGNVMDVSDYPEVSSLYRASDLLVSDYSSVMFDYSVTGKPIVLFCPDYDEYVQARGGLYFDLRTSNPGVFVETQDELVPAIKNALEFGGRGNESYKAFVDTYCGVEDGKSALRAAKYLLERSN